MANKTLFFDRKFVFTALPCEVHYLVDTNADMTLDKQLSLKQSTLTSPHGSR